MEFYECKEVHIANWLYAYATLFLHAGIVVHYVVVSMSLFWLFHVTSIFYAVVFPFSARKNLSKYKHVYLIPTFIGKLRMHSLFDILLLCMYIRCTGGNIDVVLLQILRALSLIAQQTPCDCGQCSYIYMSMVYVYQ